MTKARDLADLLDSNGNLIAKGVVDGRDLATDGSKLDGIEAAATADQDHSEIRALITIGVDTNVFTDADHTKLDGIEASATADQTDAEIRAALEAATVSNVFTDADHTKLNAIEASADVTDTVNVVAALTAGSNITIAANGTIAGAAQYTHPTHAGDDAAIDTGALSGATVISDLDLNITTDTLGHVTDANATVATRNLTLGNLGYTGATNANYITNNNQLTNGAGYTTSVGDITNVSTGGGLTGGGSSGSVTVSHSDTSSQGSVNNSGANFIQDITLDTYGHITAITSAVAGSGSVPVPPDWNPASTPSATFTSSGTWSKPSGYSDSTWVIFYAVGGGGSGAGGFYSYGGGGGSAAVIAGLMGELPSSLTIVVGAGGSSSGGSNTTISDGSAVHTAVGGRYSSGSAPDDAMIPLYPTSLSGGFGVEPPSVLNCTADTPKGMNNTFSTSTYPLYAAGCGGPGGYNAGGTIFAGQLSTYAGNGGQGSTTGTATNGAIHGGGGGGRGNSPTGNGGAGSVRIWYI